MSNLRLKDFEDWMQQEEISSETIKLLEEMKEDLLRYRGKGLCAVPARKRGILPRG